MHGYDSGCIFIKHVPAFAWVTVKPLEPISTNTRLCCKFEVSLLSQFRAVEIHDFLSDSSSWLFFCNINFVCPNHASI